MASCGVVDCGLQISDFGLIKLNRKYSGYKVRVTRCGLIGMDMGQGAQGLAHGKGCRVEGKAMSKLGRRPATISVDSKLEIEKSEYIERASSRLVGAVFNRGIKWRG